jgi:uncharacterized damage-inducible protein DinB
MYFFTNVAAGKSLPGDEDPKRENYKTKAEVVAFVKKCVADGAAAIQAKSDAGLDATVTHPFNDRPVRVQELGYGLIEHSGEHYGQLVVYYRLAGLVPPESRPKR